MPLLVQLIWPSRKALLLLGSSHDSVPGMKVAYSCLPYSSPLSVSGLLIATLLFESTSLPPCDHISQLHHRPSPVAWPSAKPGGVPLACSAWHIFRKPSVSFGNASKPAAFSMLWRYTIIEPAVPRPSAMYFRPS